MSTPKKASVPKKSSSKKVAVTKSSSALSSIFDSTSFTKKLEDEDLFVFNCTNCGGIHFRHAGYIESMLPYVNPNEGAKVASESHPVKVCVSCKSSFIQTNGKFIDVTDKIDLEAWKKTEIEAADATGPGGEC